MKKTKQFKCEFCHSELNDNDTIIEVGNIKFCSSTCLNAYYKEFKGDIFVKYGEIKDEKIQYWYGGEKMKKSFK